MQRQDQKGKLSLEVSRDVNRARVLEIPYLGNQEVSGAWPALFLKASSEALGRLCSSQHRSETAGWFILCRAPQSTATLGLVTRRNPPQVSKPWRHCRWQELNTQTELCMTAASVQPCYMHTNTCAPHEYPGVLGVYDQHMGMTCNSMWKGCV